MMFFQFIYNFFYLIASCFFLLNTQKTIGKTNKVKMVAVTKPPIITIAKGFCDSEPIPEEIAAGISPMDAISAVITTALVRAFTPLKIDSSRVNLALRLL